MCDAETDAIAGYVTLATGHIEREYLPRGDLAAILTFAAGKKNPAFLWEKVVLDDLLAGAKAVSGHRNTKTLASGDARVSQGFLVARARNTRFLRLVERAIPKLAA